jgi:hypothetical protein
MLASMVHDIPMDVTSGGIHDENDLELSCVLPYAIVKNRDHLFHQGMVHPATFRSPGLHGSRLFPPYMS